MKPSIARSSWHHAVASLERAATSSGSLRSCRFLPHTILDGGVVVGMQVGEKTFLAEAPTLWQALREAQEKDRHLAFPVVIQAIRRQRFHDRKFLLQPFTPAEVLGTSRLFACPCHLRRWLPRRILLTGHWRSSSTAALPTVIPASPYWSSWGS